VQATEPQDEVVLPAADDHDDTPTVDDHDDQETSANDDDHTRAGVAAHLHPASAHRTHDLAVVAPGFDTRARGRRLR
jgi:hypothetical protein